MMFSARILLLTALIACFIGPVQAAEKIYRYGRFEQSFTASKDYADPLRDVELTVEFSGPEGAHATARGFWDGGRGWKVRFSPDKAGDWKWRSACSDPNEKGLTKSGSFTAYEYWGRNELYRHGTPRVSPDHRFLVHTDGKPWLWLADTAWNGALLSTRDEWSRYARDRAQRKFSAVQFVMTQWRAGRADERGQTAYSIADCGLPPQGANSGTLGTPALRIADFKQMSAAGSPASPTEKCAATQCLHVNPAFFQRMDEKFDVLNDAGLVAAPVLLWALSSKDKESPGTSASNDDAIALARYMVARYDAFQAVWILGGDGDYSGPNAERWKAIGRAVFPKGERRHPVGLHPRGMQSPWAEYKDEPWLDVFFYQSGHGDSQAKWRWNATQGGAADWKMDQAHPVIDAEINYEGHLDYNTRSPIGPTQVRRAAYYSLLSAPPAGVTYGAHGIWFWARKPEVPLDHPNTGIAQPWFDCLDYPGAKEMTVLHSVFISVEWWKLRPNRSLIVPRLRPGQPVDYTSYPMPALAEDRSFALIYLPDSAPIVVNLDMFPGKVDAVWIDPTNGQREVVLNWRPSHAQEMHPPTGGDWLLLLRAPKSW